MKQKKNNLTKNVIKIIKHNVRKNYFEKNYNFILMPSIFVCYTIEFLNLIYFVA